MQAMAQAKTSEEADLPMSTNPYNLLDVDSTIIGRSEEESRDACVEEKNWYRQYVLSL